MAGSTAAGNADMASMMRGMLRRGRPLITEVARGGMYWTKTGQGSVAKPTLFLGHTQSAVPGALLQSTGRGDLRRVLP